MTVLHVLRNLLAWPFTGTDGLTPWERRRLAREFERIYLRPLREERDRQS